jgi:dolichol-phosphate mannosyltransferase
MANQTIVVVPTYNEAANLPALVDRLLSLSVPNLELLFVDDASPDGTGQIAEDLAREFPGRIHVIHRPGKLGLGTAYLQGFRWALEHGADYVIQMDADFSHSPEYLPQFLEFAQEFDVVVGSRYVHGGQVDEHWSPGRRLLSWWANSVWTQLILGVKTRDATGGFKCWRRSALEQIDLQKVRSSGYVFQVEMCFAAERLGLRIKEIPIYFPDRHIGKSKMSVLVKLEAAWRVFEIRWRYQTARRIKRTPRAATVPLASHTTSIVKGHRRGESALRGVPRHKDRQRH